MLSLLSISANSTDYFKNKGNFVSSLKTSKHKCKKKG